MNADTMVAYGLYDGAELVYIGVTRDPRIRLREHSLQGMQFTRMEILSSKLPMPDAEKKERELIAAYTRKHAGRLPLHNERAA